MYAYVSVPEASLSAEGRLEGVGDGGPLLLCGRGNAGEVVGVWVLLGWIERLLLQSRRCDGQEEAKGDDVADAQAGALARARRSSSSWRHRAMGEQEDSGRRRWCCWRKSQQCAGVVKGGVLGKRQHGR